VHLVGVSGARCNHGKTGKNASICGESNYSYTRKLLENSHNAYKGQMRNLFEFLDSKSRLFLLEQCTPQQIVPLHHTRNRAITWPHW